MDELDYLLALTQMKGIGSIRAKQLIDFFGSAKAVFDADANTLMQTHAGEVLLPQIDNPKVLANAHNERLWAESKHIRLLALKDDDYPSRLKDIPDPRLCFTIWGMPRSTPPMPSASWAHVRQPSTAATGYANSFGISVRLCPTP